MKSKLLTIDEAADLTRLSPNTLRWFRAKGTGPASAKLGRRIVYREDEVLAWIDQQFDSPKHVGA